MDRIPGESNCAVLGCNIMLFQSVGVDGLTIMRANEVAFLRLTDRFGGLGCFLFNIGMFHFYWFCMIIIFNIMWLWGFVDLVKLLNKASRVTKEAKKFNDSDQFYFLVYDSFFLYALEAQRVQLGLPDSWAGFQSFLHHRKGKTDQVRTQWVEFFCSYGWWYVALRMAVRRGDGALQFLLIKAFLPLFVWFGHCQYKFIMAAYILNSLFLWSPFWVDVMRRNASVHG